MFEALRDILHKPHAFDYANSTEMWNNPHISQQMLRLHLDPDRDPASRNQAFMEKSIHWLAQKCPIQANTRTLDLGCGPGLYAFEFAKMGAQVTGIDISKISIDYATQRAADHNLPIDYIHANYVTCEFTGTYDVITLIYNDFCALPPDDRNTLLRKISSALEATGVFVLDVLSPAHFEKTQEKHTCAYSESGGFWSPEEHVMFESIYTYPDERIFLEKNTIIEPNNRFTIYNYLKCFERDEIIRELSEHGLHTIEYFSDIAGAEYTASSAEIALINGKQ